ncbi:hypothetical protein GJ496_004010 [Pomphorhynchus laevis]|nr:hypothetical protein GJ496_004010 [Pomphorhynchus laevis]
MHRVKLNSTNFDSIVFNSPNAWFIDFYVPWCGYCIKFSHLYDRFLRENSGWNAVVQFGSINCEYEEICAIYKVSHFPTLLYFSPMTNSMTPAMRITEDLFETPIIKIVVDILSREKHPSIYWPKLRASRIDNIFAMMTNEIRQLLIIVDGNELDILSRVLILDFAAYKNQLPILRVSPSVMFMLANQFNHQLSNIVGRGLLRLDFDRRTIERLDRNNVHGGNQRHFYRSLISKALQDRNISPVIQENPINITTNVDIPIIRYKNVKMQYRYSPHMNDLESCIHYIIRIEVAKNHFIEKESIRALKNILNLLIECFPGRREVILFLERLRNQIINRRSITGAELRQLSLADNGEYILPASTDWKHCQGSQPEYRGYPCSLWMLFHTLSVSHANRRLSGNPSSFSAADLMSTFVDYIYNFFSCYLCRKHFKKATISHRDDLEDENDAVLYIWKIHNRVNQRLANDETEDPLVPKIQFPSYEQCPDCYYNINNKLAWNEQNLVIKTVVSDVFLHFPPGSNNRLFETERERLNPYRLFDSQNGKYGGYNVAINDSSSTGINPSSRIQYKFFHSGSDTAKSYLNIKWDDLGLSEDSFVYDYNVVLQYKCDQIENDDDRLSETHESLKFYEQCRSRERTLGIYTSDQKLSIDRSGYSSAIHTRQNSAGIRYGNECPEERDYYPYWHISPWIDIAVFPKNVKNCEAFTSESFNINARFACLNETTNQLRWNNVYTCVRNGGKWLPLYNYMEKVHSTEKSCRYAWRLPYDAENSTDYACIILPDPPKCIYNRHNQYNWDLPVFKLPGEKRCVIRIRLNVSSSDYNPASVNSSFNHVSGKYPSPVLSHYQFNHNNYTVTYTWPTTFLGTTFEDRSHIFILKAREGTWKETLYNINVLGKRGTKMTVSPSETLNFHPTLITAKPGDLIHFQWTGTNQEEDQYISAYNYNFHNSKSIVRHNLVQCKERSSQYPLLYDNTTFWSQTIAIWPLNGKQTNYDIAVCLASSGYYMFKDDYYRKPVLSSNLGESHAIFRGIVLKIKESTLTDSIYHFLCTCNNRIGFVDQKLTIIINN